ncbi:hypothetical protein GKZ68_11760 [Hymenobacter sp. BRD128]|uniref:hypothetical protein n=1 Tax=Hymenobacter sp. BRD128 TaxID=2675878 RepID=UPI0015668C5A|nr:hypothetical protein [Hymenobacter sp. BRD128]QKG57233.1 hypothetical protein GKZ68_11760 [Hymenobacter sp. BRD128]
MEFKVLETLQFEDKLLVIYDWIRLSFAGPIRNLYAYDAEGGRVWIAESRRLGDFYTGFVGDGRLLKATTWDCFCCTLDPETGKIVESIFTK